MKNKYHVRKMQHKAALYLSDGNNANVLLKISFLENIDNSVDVFSDMCHASQRQTSTTVINRVVWSWMKFNTVGVLVLIFCWQQTNPSALQKLLESYNLRLFYCLTSIFTVLVCSQVLPTHSQHCWCTVEHVGGSSCRRPRLQCYCCPQVAITCRQVANNLMQTFIITI